MQNSGLLGILLLVSALALYSLRERESLYLAFVAVGLFALAASVLLTLTFSLGWGVVPVLPLQLRAVAFAVLGVHCVGIWLLLMLVNGWPVPTWLEALLPVRGMHARKLLAAWGLFSTAGPLVGTFSFWIGLVTLPTFPEVGTVVAFLSAAACLAPIWNHLVTD